MHSHLVSNIYSHGAIIIITLDVGVAREMFWLMIFCTASVFCEAADGSMNAGPRWVKAAGAVTRPAVARGGLHQGIGDDFLHGQCDL